jgi:hypothetical protein
VLKEKLLESKESRRHHSSVATALNYPGQVERSGLLSVSTTDDELAEGTSTTRSSRSVWFLAMCRGMTGARPIGDGLRQTGTVRQRISFGTAPYREHCAAVGPRRHC